MYSRNIVLSGLRIDACLKVNRGVTLLLSQLHPLPLYNRQHRKGLTIRHRGDWNLDVEL
jgi:hypothetical protein